MSAPRGARSAKAMAVVASKKLAFSRSICGRSWAVHSVNAASVMGTSSTMIRSTGEIRCGDVYRPTRHPCERSSLATKAQVDPFPFDMRAQLGGPLGERRFGDGHVVDHDPLDGRDQVWRRVQADAPPLRAQLVGHEGAG